MTRDERIEKVEEMIRAYVAAAPGAPPALVWRRGDEPDLLASWDLYSQDDIDHVALVPPNTYHPWCEDSHTGTGFGCFDIAEVKLPSGWEIRVGYHG